MTDNTSLFQSNWQDLPIKDGELLLCEHFYTADEAAALFEELKNELQWRQDSLRIAGREVAIPRLQAWYGDSGTDYAYSGLNLRSLPWNEVLLKIRNRLQNELTTPFNSVLANLYRDGNDSVSWHADDEPELGTNPIIASLSLGATRCFQLKRKKKSEQERLKLDLPGGSLLVMRGALQHNWYHAVLKTKLPVGERINLTFRYIQANPLNPRGNP